MNEGFAVLGYSVYELQLPFVASIAERCLASYLGAFLFDKERVMQHTQPVRSKDRWHGGLTSLCRANIGHGPTLDKLLFCNTFRTQLPVGLGDMVRIRQQ